MKTRAIQISDVLVTKGFSNASGSVRCHFALKGAPFVNWLGWIRPEKFTELETLERIKGKLQLKLDRRVKALERYLAP